MNSTCTFCDSPCFYGDLCVVHTEVLLQKLNTEALGSDEYGERFSNTAVKRDRLRRRLEDLMAVIFQLHTEGKSESDIAAEFNIPEAYVKEVLDAMP